MDQFIDHLECHGVNVLFNRASTGRVSGIPYLVPGFKIRGQALGNQFKFGNITKQINYEENKEGSKDQSMDFEGNFRRTAGAPTGTLHNIESLLPNIPVEPGKDRKKKHGHKSKLGRGIGY